jgi:transcriptional regulator with XRE-family HTH domain
MVIKSQTAPVNMTMAASISSEEQIFMIALGKKITELRKVAELTQTQLAHALNVSQQAVQSWEGGKRRIQISMLPVIAHLLSVSLDELLDNQINRTIRKRGPIS